MITDQSAPPAPERPLVMDDIYKLIGALYLELEVLRRRNAHLTEQLARKMREGE